MNNSSYIVKSGSANDNNTENFIFVGFYSVITALGLFLNSLVIIVIKRKKAKRTVNDFFILNLALSDLLFTLCIPSDIYGLLTKHYTQLFCKVFPPFSTLTFDLSVCTLTSMAIERHGVILKPLRPKMTRKSTYVWLAMIWFVACLCVLPYVIVIKSGERYCEEDWPSFKYKQVYTLSLFVLQYLLPLLVIGGCYIKIGFYLANRTKPGDHTKRPRSLSIIKKLRNRKQNIQATKVLAALIFVFAIANLPGQIAWLLLDFGPTSYYSTAFLMIKIAHILGCLHSFSNALIYGALAKHFRQEYGNIICGYCFCCRKKGSKTPLKRSKAQKRRRKRLNRSPFSNQDLNLTHLEEDYSNDEGHKSLVECQDKT